MRVRKKKNLQKRMERVQNYMLKAPGNFKGRFLSEFHGYTELHLEIGCGKGKFIAETAGMHPEIFFIALEKISDVLIMAVENAALLGLPNVRFILGDAGTLEDIFADGEIDRLYINFCDPWPSRRHEKRRLTSAGFLSVYRKILAENAEIHFKTDNQGLFEYSVSSFESGGFTLLEITRDLHGEGLHGGAMTEYETRFKESGVPICRLTARKLLR